MAYHLSMDFSRPDNARRINRLKVLSELRKGTCSKAELSRRLDINKVSIGEICDKMIKEGLIEETGREQTAQGRPGTLLSINSKAGLSKRDGRHSQLPSLISREGFFDMNGFQRVNPSRMISRSS